MILIACSNRQWRTDSYWSDLTEKLKGDKKNVRVVTTDLGAKAIGFGRDCEKVYTSSKDVAEKAASEGLEVELVGGATIIASGEILASNAARELAKENGIDLADVEHDGPKITKPDVARHIEKLAESDETDEELKPL